MHSSVRACVSQRRVSYRFLQSRCKERKRGLTQQPSARNVNWIGMGMYSPFFPFFIFFRDKVSPSLWVLPSTVFSSRLFFFLFLSPHVHLFMNQSFTCLWRHNKKKLYHSSLDLGDNSGFATSMEIRRNKRMCLIFTGWPKSNSGQDWLTDDMPFCHRNIFYVKMLVLTYVYTSMDDQLRKTTQRQCIKVCVLK